jgi:long-chain acyl-CoA synthetase
MAGFWLLERLRQWETDTAVVWQDRTYSYGELAERVQACGRRLDEAGIHPGAVVALEGDYSPSTLAALLALVDRGVILVPHGHALEAQCRDFYEIAEVQAVVTVAAAEQWQIRRQERLATHPLTRALIDRGEPGLVLFTSGSTGRPKASLHSMPRFLRKFERARAPLRTVALPLLDHVAGLDTLFYSLSSGGTLLCPSGRDPEAVCRTIERHRAELLPASPSFLRLLLISEAYRSHDLSSLRVIAYGAEVVPEVTLERLREICPQAKLLQKYGMTELGSPPTKSREDGSLWLKIDAEGVKAKVVDGVLWVRAETAMLGYLNAPSPFDAEGWLCTGDLVEAEGEYLRVMGRQSEIINVGGQKVYPAEVESLLLQMENVREATVYAEPSPLLGHIVAARVQLLRPEELSSLKQRLRAVCRERLDAYKVPVKVEIAAGDDLSRRGKKARLLTGRA